MTWHVDDPARECVLRWASQFTIDQASPSAVMVNAFPLLDWLEKSLDECDFEVRHAALSRLHNNRNAAQTDPDDDPARFVAEAEVFYAFMAAGRTTPSRRRPVTELQEVEFPGMEFPGESP